MYLLLNDTKFTFIMIISFVPQRQQCLILLIRTLLKSFESNENSFNFVCLLHHFLWTYLRRYIEIDFDNEEIEFT